MAEHREREELAAYALGLLDERDHRRVETHLRGCAGCEAELAEHRAVAETLSQTLPSERAPAAAWQAIEAGIRERRGRSLGFPRFRWPALPGALQPALIALLVLAVAGLIGWNSSLQARISGRTTVATVPAAAGETVVALVGQSGVSGLSGHLVMSEDRHKGGLVVGGLPKLVPGRTYQIWFVRADQSRVSAGAFQVDALGQGVSIIAVPQPASDFAGVAVSEEPASGSPSPTSRDLLAGPIYE